MRKKRIAHGCTKARILPEVRYRTVRPSCLGSHLLVFVYSILLLCLTLAGPAVLIYESLAADGTFSTTAYENLLSLAQSRGRVAFTGVAFYIPSAIVSAFLASRLVFAKRKSGFPMFITLIPFVMGIGLLSSGFSSLSRCVPSIPHAVFNIVAAIAYMTPVAAMVILPRSRAFNLDLRSTSETLGYNAGRSFRKTEGRLLRPVVIASVLICLAYFMMKITPSLTRDLPMQDACALTSLMTVFYFILLLIGGRLLRKAR